MKTMPRNAGLNIADRLTYRSKLVQLLAKSWLRALAFCGAAALLTLPVPAQAVATATGPDGSAQVGGGISYFQQGYGQKQVAGGLTYVDVRPHWRYGLEGEARFLRAANAAYISQSTYLGGVKIIVSPGPSRIQPYVKLLAGAAHIILPYGYASGTFAAYAPGVGLDVKLGDYFRFRVLDVEYQQWQNFPFGALSPYGISTGISVRINRLERFPRRAYYWRER